MKALGIILTIAIAGLLMAFFTLAFGWGASLATVGIVLSVVLVLFFAVGTVLILIVPPHGKLEGKDKKEGDTPSRMSHYLGAVKAVGGWVLYPTRLILSVVLLLFIYLLMWARFAPFMTSYEAANGPTWAILFVAGAIALATMLKGALRWIFVIPLAMLLVAMTVPPFLTAASGRTAAWQWPFGGSNTAASTYVEPAPRGPCGSFDITVGVVPGPAIALISDECPHITWHIEAGKQVEVYDIDGNFLTDDEAGQFHDLRGKSPARFAAVGSSSVRIKGETW